MIQATEVLLKFWRGPGDLAVLGAGLLGLLWCFVRWSLVERVNPVELLEARTDGLIRWLLLHRRSPKTFPISLALTFAGAGLGWASNRPDFCVWSFEKAQVFVGAHAVAVILLGVVGLMWNRAPKYVKQGEGRADAQFSDVPEEWGPRAREDGKLTGPALPTAELLGFRSPARLARRLLESVRYRGHLTLIALRWDILSGHVFLVGPQGSGKTTSFYGHLMVSANCPWVYQDSKAELPFLAQFQDRPVWGLDIRGHETRSAVWNPLEEIRTAEDFDLIVDHVFPVNPHDNNPWVRQMAREIFGAILRAKRWQSIQEIGRSLRKTRLVPFLQMLEPIYQDTMKEPKSQVPVLQDLVTTLSRWSTERVSAITEGHSTVSLDDFITRGGYVMNCEASEALKVPVLLFWAMLQGRLRNRPEHASPVLLLLDEFGDCGRIPNIQTALVVLRSKGVSIVAAIQNLGLLQDVYQKEWKAVIEGFASKIFLTRNLEDELRQQLSLRIGKFTRRLPPSGKNAKETEKEADLMPLDFWGAWSQARAAIGRMHGFTYWLPVPLSIPSTPLGPRKPEGDPWGSSEAEMKAAADAAVQDLLGLEGKLQLPAKPPMPGDFEGASLASNATEPPDADTEDWL